MRATDFWRWLGTEVHQNTHHSTMQVFESTYTYHKGNVEFHHRMREQLARRLISTLAEKGNHSQDYATDGLHNSVQLQMDVVILSPDELATLLRNAYDKGQQDGTD